MAVNGGDPSGVNLFQLGRVPGTFNTKNGGRFLVHAERTSGKMYCLDDLRAAWPEVAPALGDGLSPTRSGLFRTPHAESPRYRIQRTLLYWR